MAKEDEKLPCDVHEFKLQNHSARLDKIDEVLDKVRNRLPVWATFVFGVLLAIIGYLLSFARAVK